MDDLTKRLLSVAAVMQVIASGQQKMNPEYAVSVVEVLDAARKALASQTQGEGDEPLSVAWTESLRVARNVISDMVRYGVITTVPGSTGYYVGENVLPTIFGNAPLTPSPTLEPSDAEVERAALALYEEDDAWSTALPWESLETSQANEYRRLARAALIASRQPTSGERE